ncbi:hypothetical protein D3C85_1203470 [compost metagenome]
MFHEVSICSHFLQIGNYSPEIRITNAAWKQLNSEYHEIHFLHFHQLRSSLNEFRSVHIIGINKADDVSACFGKTQIAGITHTAVFFQCHYFDTYILEMLRNFLQKTSCQFQTSVRTFIIYKDEFIWQYRLINNRLQCFTNVRRFVVQGNDNGKFHLIRFFQLHRAKTLRVPHTY